MHRDLEDDVFATEARRLARRFQHDLEASAGHRERMHRLRHAARERVGCLAALFAKITSKRVVSLERNLYRARERLRIGRFGKLRESRARRLGEIEQRFRTHAMLSREI